MIRVLMVDDEPLVRRGIVAGVDWAALGCEVVGEAQSGEGWHHDDEPFARRGMRGTLHCADGAQ